MPAVIEDEMIGSTDGGIATLPFPPITKAHIMNCSYHSWHPKYAKQQVKPFLSADTNRYSDIALSHRKLALYPSASLSSITFAPTVSSSQTTTNRASSRSGQKIAVSFQHQTRTRRIRTMSTRMSRLGGGTFTPRYKTLLRLWAAE